VYVVSRTLAQESAVGVTVVSGNPVALASSLRHEATTGQSIEAFVILRESAHGGGDDVVKQLRDHVAKQIGAIAKPRSIMVVPELPKTRSGKIMRRLLKDVAENREPGDSTTLADSTVMDLIQANLSKTVSTEA
jgi:acetyl-CoA synthetase